MLNPVAQFRTTRTLGHANFGGALFDWLKLRVVAVDYPIPKEVSPIWFILFVDGGKGSGFESGIQDFISFFLSFCFLRFP